MIGALVSAVLGFGLGLSLAGPPGPVNALMLRESTRHGAWGGIRAGIPAPIVDTCYMAIVLLGLPHLIDVDKARPWLAGIGAILMLYLAWETGRVHAHGPAPPAKATSLWAVALTNPFQYAWWLSAGAVFLSAQGAWGIAGFLCAIFGWVFAFSNLAAHGAARWPWFTPAVGLLSADLLVTFSILLARTAAGF